MGFLALSKIWEESCWVYYNSLYNTQCPEKYKTLWFSRLYFFLLCFAKVSVVLEAWTLVTYIFQKPYPVTKNLSLSLSAIYVDMVPSKDNTALSFVTDQAPSLLSFIDFRLRPSWLLSSAKLVNVCVLEPSEGSRLRLRDQKYPRPRY